MNNKHCTQKEHVRFLLQSADIRAGVIKLQEVLSPFGFDIQLKVAGGFFCPDGNELEISWNEKPFTSAEPGMQDVHSKLAVSAGNK